jgi:hypothetical protein
LEIEVTIHVGEKIHVITRRRFEGDSRRHFVGEIKEAEGSIVRAEGYAFIFNTAKNEFIKKPEKRTSIFQLAESGYIVNLIPKEVSIDSLIYRQSGQKNLVVTDNHLFCLDINEFGINR